MRSGLTHNIAIAPPKYDDALKMRSEFQYLGHVFIGYAYILVQFVQFPILYFGLDHFTSQPFNCPRYISTGIHHNGHSTSWSI